MILIDVNVLLYAVDSGSAHHTALKPWLTTVLNQPDGMALCWPVISGFVRISTNPKAFQNPLTTAEACQRIDEWLALPGTRLLHSPVGHWQTFSNLLRQSSASGNVVSDARLAALALDHDIELASTDTDFANFPGLRWINPLVP